MEQVTTQDILRITDDLIAAYESGEFAQASALATTLAVLAGNMAQQATTKVYQDIQGRLLSANIVEGAESILKDMP